MFSFLWALVVRGIVDAVAGVILGRDVPGGITGNIIVGFLGSQAASLSLPPLGSVIGGFPVISALLGAIVCIIIYSFIASRKA